MGNSAGRFPFPPKKPFPWRKKSKRTPARGVSLFQSPAAPERARQRLHAAIPGELGLRFQPVLLISPGDVHGAGTTPDLLLYRAPRSRKVSAARTAHTSGSFGSSSGSPRAGAGNISLPHAHSWPPPRSCCQRGHSFFGVSCPKKAGWEEPRYSLAPVKALISSALRQEKKKSYSSSKWQCKPGFISAGTDGILLGFPRAPRRDGA